MIVISSQIDLRQLAFIVNLPCDGYDRRRAPTGTPELSSPLLDCTICPVRHLSTFKSLEPELVDLVNDQKRSNLYRKGQIVFYEGNPSYGLFCLNSGRVKLFKMTTEGKRLTLRIAEPGDQLGHLSLLSGQPYSASAEALEDSVICFIDRKIIFPILSEQKDVSWAILQNLAKEMIVAQNRAIDIAHRSVRERMAGLLLLLNEKYGHEHEEGILLDLKLSRSDLADLIGISEETSVRVLTDFREELLIRDQNRQILLLAQEKLSDIAGFLD